MAKTQSQLIDEILPLLRTSISGAVETSDFQDSLNRAIRHLQNKLGIYATKNRSEINVFPSVYEYPMPSDFHDPINFQTPGKPRNFNKHDSDEFWKRILEEDNIFSVDSITGTRFLLLKASSAGSAVQLNSMDSLTANGAWATDAVNGDATNLTIDSVNKKSGSGSINFDVDVSQTANDQAIIVNSTMTAKDLTIYNNQGTLFFWVYIPDSTNVTGLTARWGSSSSNYFSGSATTGFNGTALRNGWNRIGIDWPSATETGTVDVTAINYLYLQVSFSVSQTDDTDFRFDDVRMENPELMENHYYSKTFVQSNANVLQAAFSAADDASLLEDQDDDLLVFYVLQDAHLIRENYKDVAIWKEKFDEEVKSYKKRYPSEKKPSTRRWY